MWGSLNGQTLYSNVFSNDLCLLEAVGAAALLAWHLIQSCLQYLHFLEGCLLQGNAFYVLVDAL